MIWILIIIIIPMFIITISVAPGRIPPGAERIAKTFRGLNCAHRGLHTEDQSIPENSIAAFAAAREHGFGVELDIHLTADDQVVVFHDYDLLRACGVDKKLCDMTYNELYGLRLFGTDERIPLLMEALEVLDDTPVIVELKPAGRRNSRLCQKALEVLRVHGRNWCVESFDPRICRWFKKNAPDVFRGQLSCPPSEYTGISRMSSIIIGNLLLNSIARPHFIAYKNTRYPLVVKICMIMKPMKAIWTINPKHDISKAESKSDFVIFEHYIPTPRFKQLHGKKK